MSDSDTTIIVLKIFRDDESNSLSRSVTDSNYVEYGQDGQVITEGHMKSGVIHGLVKLFNRGRMFSSWEYDMGVITESTSYDAQGGVRDRSRFKDGRMVEMVSFAHGDTSERKVFEYAAGSGERDYTESRFDSLGHVMRCVRFEAGNPVYLLQYGENGVVVDSITNLKELIEHGVAPLPDLGKLLKTEKEG